MNLCILQCASPSFPSAGISKAATIEETTVEDFDKLFAVNVRAPFFLVQQFLPIMSKGSSIVFVSMTALHLPRSPSGSRLVKSALPNG
jgi:NAD(P)-dependent dehydrogenase (short-subunit alcohol dehydrogenase family)